MDNLISSADAIRLIEDWYRVVFGVNSFRNTGLCRELRELPPAPPQSTMGQVTEDVKPINDCISRQETVSILMSLIEDPEDEFNEGVRCSAKMVMSMPSVQPEILACGEGELNTPSGIIRCKDCKYWKQQTNYQGALLSFGFCESEDMWESLYGEVAEVEHIDTDDNHYCGYAEMKKEVNKNETN